MNIQIKKDEISKDTNNYLKLGKRIRKMLMQRQENRDDSYTIGSKIASLGVFDPLLDWSFRPICGCELDGMERVFYNIKHNKLFARNGYRLYGDCLSYNSEAGMAEGYELWMLDNMKLVFTYFCEMYNPNMKATMTYRYPLGKKIPVDMALDATDFLRELRENIQALRKTG